MKKDKVDKLTDKAFYRLIITSVLAIAFCLFCLCSTTWAWFNESETSQSNSISSGNCTLKITVDDNDNDDTDVIVCDFDSGEKDVTLNAGVTYSVKLEIPEDSASGYCIIKLVNSDEPAEIKLYSQSVSNNGSPYERELIFTIVAEENAQVKVIPCWGIYSGDEKAMNGDTVKITASSISIVSESETETESDSVSDAADGSEIASEEESEEENEEEITE